MSRPRVDLRVDRGVDTLEVRWDVGATQGGTRFDRLPDASPEWLGAADELLEGADRRTADRVLDALAAWAEAEGLELAVWWDDEGVEVLGRPDPR